MKFSRKPVRTICQTLMRPVAKTMALGGVRPAA